jgi:hypothetical protein
VVVCQESIFKEAGYSFFVRAFGYDVATVVKLTPPADIALEPTRPIRLCLEIRKADLRTGLW